MNTTHLALSEPGGAPVTTDETSPLGRRRTRGFLVLGSDRERALDNMVAATGETFKELAAVGTEETLNRERKDERDARNPEDSEK